MKQINVQLTGCYGWIYTELPIEEDGVTLKGSYKDQKLSDIHIGIDKANGKQFLSNLEYLTREDVSAELSIPLSIMPHGSPYHLDKKDDYIKYPRRCFDKLLIRRMPAGSNINDSGGDLTLNFGRLEIQEFFTRMYTCFELYATHEDNIVRSKDQVSGKDRRIVIWGVINGAPIFY